MAIKIRVLTVEWHFLYHFEQNGAKYEPNKMCRSKLHILTVGNSSLIHLKISSLWDLVDELHFNGGPEYA